MGRKKEVFGEERRRNETVPPPRVFSVRVANKGVMLDAARKSAATGLKVASFSVSCGASVRVARKGVKQGVV
jgi:hypothetical protein